MACGNCGTTENGVPKGCKSNGNCGQELVEVGAIS